MGSMEFIRTTRRCDPVELRPGTELRIASGKPDVLTFRIDDINHESPIYVVPVPIAWKVGVLIDGETRWIETVEPHPVRVAEAMLREEL